MALEEVTVTAKSQVEGLQTFMRQEFLRSSQFLMRIPTIPTATSAESKSIALLTESIEFPTQIAQTIDYKIPGTNRIRVPYSRDYQDVTFTFLHPKETPIYDIMSSWIDYCIAPFYGNSPTTEVNYFDEVVTDMTLIQFSDTPVSTQRNQITSLLNSIDKINAALFDSSKLFRITDIGQTFVNRLNNASENQYGFVNREKYYFITFKNAYPISISPLSGTWADDGFHKLSVTFTYEEYIINEGYRGTDTTKRKIDAKIDDFLGSQWRGTMETVNKDIQDEFNRNLATIK